MVSQEREESKRRREGKNRNEHREHGGDAGRQCFLVNNKRNPAPAPLVPRKTETLALFDAYSTVGKGCPNFHTGD